MLKHNLLCVNGMIIPNHREERNKERLNLPRKRARYVFSHKKNLFHPTITGQPHYLFLELGVDALDKRRSISWITFKHALAMTDFVREGGSELIAASTWGHLAVVVAGTCKIYIVDLDD